jgi:uncharacterized protein
MVQPANAPRRKKQQPKQKHVPQRTCIVCRQVRPKRELIRVVRTPAGHVELDPTGKKSGRGAYLCARRSCWEPALRKGKLEREFELTLLPEDRAALDAYYETLPNEPAPSASGAGAAKGKKVAAPKQAAE